MDKRFWAIIGVIVIIFIGVFYATNAKNSSNNASSSNGAALSNHVKGNSDAKVTLVEYGDFQCPVCGSYYPVVEQTMAKYKDQVKFQFRNFPLTSIHNNAFAAARAAEAAGIQGKFWEMYGAIYQNQQVWSASSNPSAQFEQYAGQIGLDTAKFKKDSASSQVNDIINADAAEANRLKLSSTPTFFINDEQVQLSDLVDSRTRQPTVDSFSKIIDQKLSQAGGDQAKE